MGPCYDGGCVEERGFGSSDAEEQHNGVHAFSVDGDHAELPHRRLDDGRQRRTFHEAVVGGPERAGFVLQVLLDTGVFPGGFPVQCAVDKILQPRQLPHQRTLPEEDGGRGWSRQPVRDVRVDGGVRGEDGEQRELFLVSGAQSILLLLPPFFVDLWTYSYVRLLHGHGLHALFPGRHGRFRVGGFNS
ncbi:hypothetical protein DM860_011014 [Cuscuta australis]|uniref:Uncharacterized protein n=1 Tax=Cuscuta australis TaxID=267555 RepID=A0A328E0K8_9ASTE|nr:hypothetical protein DM860_011014 [Cuscuta australis]